MNYKVTVDPKRPDAFRVEALDYDNYGECYVATFTGFDARARAEEYAAFRNGATAREERDSMSSQWLRFEGVDGKVYTVHEGAVLYCVSGETTTVVYLVSGASFEAKASATVLGRALTRTAEGA